MIDRVNTIVKNSATAGINKAKDVFLKTGKMSLAKNLAAFSEGRINALQAAQNIVSETGKGTVEAFQKVFTEKIRNDAEKECKALVDKWMEEAGVPGALFDAAKGIGILTYKYLNDEMDIMECFTQMVADYYEPMRAVFIRAVKGEDEQKSDDAPIKQLAKPGRDTEANPIKRDIREDLLSSLSGSAIAYVAATEVYEQIATALKEYQFAKEERIRIEKECEETITLIRKYRSEMNEKVEKYLSGHITLFENSFDQMDRAIIENDINGFIAGNVAIQEVLGHGIQFRNKEEFEQLMLSDEALIL